MPTGGSLYEPVILFFSRQYLGVTIPFLSGESYRPIGLDIYRQTRVLKASGAIFNFWSRDLMGTDPVVVQALLPLRTLSAVETPSIIRPLFFRAAMMLAEGEINSFQYQVTTHPTGQIFINCIPYIHRA